MAIQLTPEQEQRIEAIVSTGAYPSVREALDAAVIAVELAATSAFDERPEVLESLLMDGLDSVELSEEDFWASVDRDADAMLAGYKQGSRA